MTQIILNAWYRGAWWLSLFYPLEWVYLRLRKLHLRRQPNPSENPIPLLVVGNITLGGTGKTPLVVALVAALKQRGLRPAIISRGYGGRIGAGPHCVTAKDKPEQVGDEPTLLAQLTRVPVVVGWDRKAGLTWLAEQGQYDLVISDDGLQHSAIKGDLEWCLIDGARGLGNGHCLPAGPLREPSTRLHQVDQVLITGELQPQVKQQLKQLLGAQDDCLLEPQLDQLKRVADDQVAAWPSVDTPLNAIAAIGHPQRFFNDLRAKGYSVAGQGFADHHQFKPQDLPHGELIMTAKDAVKCKPMAQEQNLPWLYATQRLTLPESLVTKLIQQLDLTAKR
ncbi:MAG TPA: tetraacyldisaccharide 4'-kinase [Oceanospirillaceae bacterium]|nr:tetraacyldisaccharide 4'-kinase [Oceanospirillaceae bacterium]